MKNEFFTVASVEIGSTEWQEVRRIRIKVFVEEQKVPLEEEFDRIDTRAYHVLAYDRVKCACGTGRLFADKKDPLLGHIGRMAVISSHREKGCGTALMIALMSEAENRGFGRLVLSSQEKAAPFYEKFGFQKIGDVYMDVGIPHIEMVKELAE